MNYSAIALSLTLSFAAVSSAFAQAPTAHPELSDWVAKSTVSATVTESQLLTQKLSRDEQSELDQLLRPVHNEMVLQLQSEAAALGMEYPKYVKSDQIAVSFMQFVSKIEIRPEMSTEDLWYTFRYLKERMYAQRFYGDTTRPHAIRADMAAYYKIREIITLVESRGIYLPGLNIEKSFNYARKKVGPVRSRP